MPARPISNLHRGPGGRGPGIAVPALVSISLLLAACGDDGGPSPIPPAETGACCTDDGCRILPASDCFDVGIYLGDDITCAPPACLPEGACCERGICSLTLESDCGGLGEYQGEGTVCIPDPCPPIGACCLGTECELLSAAACEPLSGDYWGDDTLCQTLPDDFGGPNQSGVLLLHYAQGVTQTQAGRNCLLAIDSCNQIVTQAPAEGVALAAVFAAFPASASPRVQSVQFGIAHTVEIADWLSCGPLVETTPDWPGPLSGIYVSWAPSAVSDHLFPVCWFVVYATNGAMELTSHPDLGSAAFTDDAIPPITDRARALGRLGFGTEVGRRLCPCP